MKFQKGDRVLVEATLVRGGPPEDRRGPYNLVRAAWRPSDPKYAKSSDVGHMEAGCLGFGGDDSMHPHPGVSVASLLKEIETLWDFIDGSFWMGKPLREWYETGEKDRERARVGKVGSLEPAIELRTAREAANEESRKKQDYLLALQQVERQNRAAFVKDSDRELIGVTEHGDLVYDIRESP